jgi:hypothetical protein
MTKPKTSAKETLSRKEFLAMKTAIERESFRPKEVMPLAFGAERSNFEKQKLTRLISLASAVDSKTVGIQAERWQRKLAKLEKTEARFQALRGELQDHRINVTTQPQTAALKQSAAPQPSSP